MVTPTEVAVRDFLRRANWTLTAVREMGWKSHEEVIQSMLLPLEGIRECLVLDVNGKQKNRECETVNHAEHATEHVNAMGLSGLSTALRRELSRMATKEHVTTVLDYIDRLIDGHDASPVEVIDSELVQALAMDVDGTTALSQCDVESVCAQLGIETPGIIPGFNTHGDTLGAANYWQDRALMETIDLEPVTPTWHQLVGILRMLQLSFEGKPVLLMDEVGVGKTLQAAGLIAMLTYYRRFKTRTGKFPGAFGM
jgi:hypothetical protein